MPFNENGILPMSMAQQMVYFSLLWLKVEEDSMA